MRFPWSTRNVGLAFVLVGFALPPSSYAEEERVSVSKFSWRSGSVYGLYLTQGSSHHTVSTGLGWAPTYALSDPFGLRGYLGGTVLKASDGSKFFAGNAEVVATYLVSESWEVEAGGGAQYWVDNGGFKPVLSVRGSRRLEERWLGLVDRLFVAYTHVILTSADASQISLGVGFSI